MNAESISINQMVGKDLMAELIYRIGHIRRALQRFKANGFCHIHITCIDI